MSSSLPVGVYDSGIGGLTLLHTLKTRLPSENFIYYGDNQNAPYGNKSREELFTLSFNVLNEFERVGVKAVVLACNTLTTNCISYLRSSFAFPIVGTEPALSCVKDFSCPLLLATKDTIESLSVKKLKEKLRGELTCFAPPDLVHEIEKFAPDLGKVGIENHLPSVCCDSVVLGCTHFIYLSKEISSFYGVPVFDGNQGTAKRVEFILKEYKIENIGKGRISFMGTSKVVNQSIFKQMFT